MFAWFRNLLRPTVRVHRRTNYYVNGRPVTPAEAKEFEDIFREVDAVFKRVDSLFKGK